MRPTKEERCQKVSTRLAPSDRRNTQNRATALAVVILYSVHIPSATSALIRAMEKFNRIDRLSLPHTRPWHEWYGDGRDGCFVVRSSKGRGRQRGQPVLTLP